MKTVICFICFAISACSLNTSHIQVHVEDPVTPEWVADAVYNAAKLWEPLGVDFLIGETGELDIVVKDLPDDRIGEYETHGLGYGTVALVAQLEASPHEAQCTVMHEFGHSVGMDHVEQSNSLMAPFIELPHDLRECYWSQLDQDEFCSATGHGCIE